MMGNERWCQNIYVKKIERNLYSNSDKNFSTSPYSFNVLMKVALT